jgi:peptidoglycan/LPS O-acetylase OafA/YrhL
LKYFKQLDGLRFVAIFLVLLEHFAMFIGRPISAGFYGVDLFFVISGFLITKILIDSNEPFGRAYKKFIGRRTLRIFPIYYLTIFILFVIGNNFVHDYLLYCLTYTYNYAMVYFNIPNNLINPFWSLCVEEQFYLFWPFIILSLKNNLSLLKFIILALVLFCNIQIFFNVIPFLTSYNYVGLIPRASSLAVGAFGAILFKENKISIRFLENKQVEYFAFGTLFFFLIINNTLQFLAWSIISIYFILKTTHKGFVINAVNKFLNNKKIIYIGSISYGIYLFHMPIEYYLTKYFFNPFIWKKINWESLGIFRKLQWHSWIIKFPIYSLISIILSHFSYKYIEKPILLLKDKWFRYDKLEININNNKSVISNK